MNSASQVGSDVNVIRNRTTASWSSGSRSNVRLLEVGMVSGESEPKLMAKRRQRREVEGKESRAMNVKMNYNRL